MTRTANFVDTPDGWIAYQQTIESIGLQIGDTDQQDTYRSHLLQRIQAGDKQAREEFLISLLPAVFNIAARYYSYLRRLTPFSRVSLPDLVNEGNLAVLESFSLALQKEQPTSYLLFKAHAAMRDLARRESSIISTPTRDYSLPVLFPESLDAPRGDDKDCDLYETLPAPTDSSCQPQRDTTPLLEAVARLAPTQREVITRHYGLAGPSETLTELSKSLGCSQSIIHQYHQNALSNLYVALVRTPLAATSSPQKGQTSVWRTSAPSKLPELTASDIQRLEAAYAELGHPEKISGERLAKQAHIRPEKACAFLQQRGKWSNLADRQRQRYQRLEQTYIQMQQEGESITAKHLRLRAKVSHAEAKVFLAQRGIAFQDKPQEDLYQHPETANC